MNAFEEFFSPTLSWLHFWICISQNFGILKCKYIFLTNSLTKNWTPLILYRFLSCYWIIWVTLKCGEFPLKQLTLLTLSQAWTTEIIQIVSRLAALFEWIVQVRKWTLLNSRLPFPSFGFIVTLRNWIKCLIKFITPWYLWVSLSLIS